MSKVISVQPITTTRTKAIKVTILVTPTATISASPSTVGTNGFEELEIDISEFYKGGRKFMSQISSIGFMNTIASFFIKAETTIFVKKLTQGIYSFPSDSNKIFLNFAETPSTGKLEIILYEMPQSACHAPM